jgi:hypothetical protein
VHTLNAIVFLYTCMVLYWYEINMIPSIKCPDAGLCETSGTLLHEPADGLHQDASWHDTAALWHPLNSITVLLRYRREQFYNVHMTYGKSFPSH